jgi:glycosyltransferase involved in cell wall biosynthesis
MVRLIRGGRFDLVYGNNTSRSCRNALIAAKLAGARFIGHFRTMANGKPRLRFAHLNLADAVIAISNACARALAGRILKSKVRVVYNGVEINDFAACPDGLRARLRGELGFRAGVPAVVSVGNLTPRKGQHHAVAAIADARRRGVDLDLRLVGLLDRKPEYVADVRRQVLELGVQECVTFAGFKSDVTNILSVTDILVHTAASEAFGRALIEAMAAGVPVVAFAVDGVEEIVVDGKTGFLVPEGDTAAMADALSRLASDPPLRRWLGENGRARVLEHFSAEQTALRVRGIIEDLFCPPEQLKGLWRR